MFLCICFRLAFTLHDYRVKIVSTDFKAFVPIRYNIQGFESNFGQSAYGVCKRNTPTFLLPQTKLLSNRVE